MGHSAANLLRGPLLVVLIFSSVCVSVGVLSEGLVLASSLVVVLLCVVEVVGLVAVVAVTDDRMLDAFALQLVLLLNALQLSHQLLDERLQEITSVTGSRGNSFPISLLTLSVSYNCDIVLYNHERAH